ncbi:MAG: hypothetical protein LKI34_06010 [Bifidobacterium tibiigranuli]|jgi:hypothetical protein|uniref:hypothetical protein n=1 Tax=Bifidobacterium tibiigranuli TaxID=2172043 RepID=UPI0026F0C538|nr:hypothetical protein [Bifidobacterium tibiigranuli]MCI1673749.1 hypothetical protein [Bifidobacterium tibiigranuli]MCI1711998.1 hypothetical protein [Bifidobacterium tibiigranuli]
MADREMDFKVMRNGDRVSMIESSGFLGGLDYAISVNGQVKEVSSDMSFIRKTFNDRYNY